MRPLLARTRLLRGPHPAPARARARAVAPAGVEAMAPPPRLLPSTACHSAPPQALEQRRRIPTCCQRGRRLSRPRAPCRRCVALRASPPAPQACHHHQAASAAAGGCSIGTASRPIYGAMLCGMATSKLVTTFDTRTSSARPRHRCAWECRLSSARPPIRREGSTAASRRRSRSCSSRHLREPERSHVSFPRVVASRVRVQLVGWSVRMSTRMGGRHPRKLDATRRVAVARHGTRGPGIRGLARVCSPLMRAVGA